MHGNASAMIRHGCVALLLASAGTRAAQAQAELASVAPVVPCASLRAFDPRVPDAPTQVTDARDTSIAGKQTCVVKGYVSAVVRAATRAQRRRLVALRADGTIGDAAFQRVEEELDWAELDWARLVEAGHTEDGAA